MKPIVTRTDPVRLGDLYVWQSGPKDDLMLGNAAAASGQSGVSDAHLSADFTAQRPTVAQWAFDETLAPSATAPPVRVRLSECSDLSHFRAMFAAMITQRPAKSQVELITTPAGTTVWRDGACIDQSASASEPVVLIHHLRDTWFGASGFMGTIHGACLELEGHSVALLGTSGSGKSTLSAHLSTRGARYVSDDIFSLSQDANVFRYPVPPNLKSPSWPLLRGAYPELDDGPVFPKGDQSFRMLTSAPFIDAGAMPGPSLYVVLRYKAGAATRHVDLTLDEVFLRLAGREFWVARGKLPVFVDTLRKARFVALEYSDWTEAEQFVRAALKGTA